MNKPIVNDGKFTVGKEGWLFLSNDTNRVMEQITGTYNLAGSFDVLWKEVFKFRKKKLDALGVKYTFLIAPNKECVYEQFLPPGLSLSDKRPVSRVLEQATGHVEVIYPLHELRELAGSVDVFPKGDTHWNLLGALAAYRLFVSKIGVHPVQDSEIEFYTDSQGDLSSKIGQSTEYVRGRIRRPNYKVVFDNRVPNTGNRKTFENRDLSLPSCVMFRDSFGSILLDVLAQTFSRFTAVWQANIDYEIVEEFRPDFVLSEQAERFVAGVPNDLNGKSNVDYVKEKMEM